MIVTATQLVAHAVGDYLLQSDWMATEKTKKTSAALAHVITYTLPFLLLTTAPLALLAIAGSHFVIDRWRLARYVVWLKNFVAPRREYVVQRPVQRMTWDPCHNNGTDASGDPLPQGRECWRTVLDDTTIVARTPPWADCAATGYPPDRPAWLVVWLLIIADNTMHIICNALALTYLA